MHFRLQGSGQLSVLFLKFHIYDANAQLYFSQLLYTKYGHKLKKSIMS